MVNNGMVIDGVHDGVNHGLIVGIKSWGSHISD